MKRLTILSRYISKLDDSDYLILDEQVNRKGLDKAFNDYLSYLDCTRLCNGNRITQTINAGYKRDMALAVKLIERFEDADKDKAITSLLERHNKNLEFEKVYGNTVYEKKKAKPKAKPKAKASSKPKVRKQKELFNPDAFVPNKILFKSSNFSIGK